MASLQFLNNPSRVQRVFNQLTIRLATTLLCLGSAGMVTAQGLHFSQYYDAPMLLSPANTALMPDADYRVGVNFRNQWASVPAPFQTFSAYVDGRLFQPVGAESRLGLGFALFSDKAGDGDLALNRYELFAAYHQALGETALFSVGLSGAYVTRSVDFSKLSFDAQWDGQTFNKNQANGELPGRKQTSYADVNAGINLALYPNDAVYMKFGVAIAHVNQPEESFYGNTSKLGMRPTANAEVIARVGNGVIIHPSAYYANQRGAQELVYGNLFLINMASQKDVNNTLILGLFNRWGDAVIPAIGFELSGLRVLATYDVTISKLSPYNRSAGAFEIGLRWQGRYPYTGSMPRNMYGCPRF